MTARPIWLINTFMRLHEPSRFGCFRGSVGLLVYVNQRRLDIWSAL